jgi:hypothetical protein
MHEPTKHALRCSPATSGSASTSPTTWSPSTWDKAQGWHDAQVRAYGPLSLDPAASVLHYGQEIFEGIKAYRHADGSIWTFRPDANGARLQRSAARLALPQLPVTSSWNRCASWSRSMATGCRRRRRPACTSVPS